MGGKTYRYEYDANGACTRKSNADGGYTQYYLIDGIAVAEQRFNSSGVELYTLRYSLDENNSPVGFAIQYPSETAWTNYYFAKNLQGDVIALYRSDYNYSTGSYYGTRLSGGRSKRKGRTGVPQKQFWDTSVHRPCLAEIFHSLRFAS